MVITGAKRFEDAVHDFTHFVNHILARCWDSDSDAVKSSAKYRQVIERAQKEKEVAMILSGAPALLECDWDKTKWNRMAHQKQSTIDFESYLFKNE